MRDAAKKEPPDQWARHRITEVLDANFLVEAGAGSGKTTSLVDRMVALVRLGVCKVDEIAAVTFTRKAAAELRQRFQVELEQAGRRVRDESQRTNIEGALQNLDGAFLGTIHSFCAKLLRERPLEAGLDPDFRELSETEAVHLQRTFWLDYLERLGADGDPQLRRLEKRGLRPEQLEKLYEKLVANPDVDFGAKAEPPPDEGQVAAVRADLDTLLDRAEELLPSQEPEKGWDPFAKKVRTLLYLRRSFGWDDRVAFFDALAKLYDSKARPTQNRWSSHSHGRFQAKLLGEAFHEFGKPEGPAGRLVQDWWAYRYPVAVAFAKGAADAYARERKELGLLTFQDDLVLAAELLRSSPATRRDLGRRYRRLLVDEFQDTDPLQAEIIFLLASEPAGEDDDWTRARPRPGALFVVGDPKQSIYRFRRADIALYESVKRRFEEFGEVLRLEANFRSLTCIEKVVKGVFDSEQMFPARDKPSQAAFAPLLAQRSPAVGCGPGVLRSYPIFGKTQDQAAEDDARFIAAHVAERVASGERKPGDFMVLTRLRKHLALYARMLEEWSLPVQVSGAGVDFEDKLSAFLLLLKCMADPAHQVRVLGALVGPFFGITLDEIVAYREAGGWLEVNRPPRLRDGVAAGLGGGPGDARAANVVEALDKLHGWWERARREPADVTAERLAAETGLFPLAAAGSLGQLRAGALVYLLDAVRAKALEGNASLAGAVEAMETALEWDDAMVSLVPGRGNAVRVMNLHQAKGLEEKVVFLGSPFGEHNRTPSMRVERGDDGVARGAMPVLERQGRRKVEVIAKPRTWEEDEKAEVAFELAERVRLLYVAATRAKDELWVARWEKRPKLAGKSPWARVERWIGDEAAREAGTAGDGGPGAVPVADLVADAVFGVRGPDGLDDGRAGAVGDARAVAARQGMIARQEAPQSEELDPTTDLTERVAAAEAAVKDAGTPTYKLETVTNRARASGPGNSNIADSGFADNKSVANKVDAGGAAADEAGAASASVVGSQRFAVTEARPLSGGAEWGTIVHAMLAAVEEGEEGDVLAARARNLLVKHGRTLDVAGNPKELDALLALVADVSRSEVWARAMASRERRTEVPFAVAPRGASGLGSADQPAVAERPAVADQPAMAEQPAVADQPAMASQPAVLEGVIDLVFREADGWVVADYKTDTGADPKFPARVPEYRRQVDIYADCWERITGETVKERLLVFTAQGRVESW